MNSIRPNLAIAGGLLCMALGLIVSPGRASADGLELELEVGAVYSSRNDARIPGDEGTKFSLTDDLASSVEPVSRVRIGYRFGSRHLVTALYAPLTLTAKGTVDRDLEFAGRRYPADSTLLAIYRFDSYRLTYRYSIIRQSDLEVAVGATGKIRDAEFALYGPAAREKTNTGFVPLVNLHVEWRPGDGRFGLLLNADALAAPQGRAEDVLLAATVALRDGLSLYAGYRTLEGGADNDEVYTFAWLHYGVAGVRIHY